MSVITASINSGSNGNCYYIGSEHEAVLIDAGISCRETEKRMRRMGLSMDRVKAIFISHEHGDHIRGVETISAKYSLPVYITENTLRHSRLRLRAELIRGFSAYEPICVGSLSVLPFPKMHDAADPHSFNVQYNDITIGIYTDIGTPCKHVVENFRKCTAAFLESNYDDTMLEAGRYPYHLKKRISGDYGHLSNAQAAQLFLAEAPANMTHLWLSHLSKDNNNPEAALAAFEPHCCNTSITVASRYSESEIFEVNGQAVNVKKQQTKTVQLEMF